MLYRKIATPLAVAGLLAANVAFALPGFSSEAPQRSVEACVAEVDANADYVEARSIVHNVETRERRVSGHKMSIRTIVVGEGDTVIREYAALCAIDDDEEIRHFRIRQTAR